MTPNDLEQFAKLIEKLRIDILLGEGTDDLGNVGLGPMSEQYLLLSLGALDQAERFMKIAHFHLMRKD